MSYVRISKDDTDQRFGVGRQKADCAREIEARGWAAVGVYEDNDVSAFSGRTRPHWKRLIADVRTGMIDAIVCSEATRLTRGDLRDCEDFIDLALEHGVRVVTLAEGDYDLARASGRKRFRDDAVKARNESETMSERIRRQRDQAAEAGRPHGMIAYGYRREPTLDERGRYMGSRDVIDPLQAGVVRESAQRLLRGETLRAICRDLNARDLLSPRGTPWSSTTLRQVLLRDRNAGLRRHRGRVVGRAAWEPIYDQGTHDRVLAILRDPSRLTGSSNKGATPKYLLSGIARCGRCSGPMRVTKESTSGGRRVPARYQCRDCLRVARSQQAVERFVEQVVMARLRQADALSALAAGSPERANELDRMIREAEARVSLAADAFAEGTWTADQVRRINARLLPQIEDWRAQLIACAPREGLLELIGPDADQRWVSSPLEIKRSVIDTLMTIKVMPVGSGSRFDPAAIEIVWKT